MEGPNLIVSLPGDVPTVGSPTRRDLLLAAVSLPEAHLGGLHGEVNLDESRSESSKSSVIDHSIATGNSVPGSVSGEPSNDDTNSEDMMSPGELSDHSRGAGVMKRAWQPEEDELLLKLVTELGPCHWSVIAGHLEGRVGKQCRER